MQFLFLTPDRKVHRGRVALLAAILPLFAPGPRAAAQDTPLISGAVGFFSSPNHTSTLQPVLSPLLAAPLGSHLLVESRGTLSGTFSSQTGANGPYHEQFVASLNYLQLDYIATSKLTIVGGKFLTPFGTYNERLTPIWLPNLANAPLILGIGITPSGYNNGGQVRGVLFSNDKVQLNYVAYGSGSSNLHEFASGRVAGYQLAVYLPTHRLEVGTSYQRLLQGTHVNASGVHVWWLPYRVPLEVRSEYAHGARSQGYWIEAAYRLSQWHGPDSLVGRLEPVFRMQQTFGSDGVPAVNKQEADFGLDYHLPNVVRLNTSYGRSFASTGNANIWNFSLTYRFLFPAWKGHK